MRGNFRAKLADAIDGAGLNALGIVQKLLIIARYRNPGEDRRDLLPVVRLALLDRREETAMYDTPHHEDWDCTDDTSF